MQLKRTDAIFSAAAGLAVSWLAIDFFGQKFWPAIILLPILSVAGLWICYKIAEKYFFVRQVGKFVLAGAFADVVDIKIFQAIFLFFPFPITLKAASFILATFVKYFLDKHWSFEKPEPKDMHKEMAKFFMIAMGGLAINVVSFYFFTKINVQAMPARLWMELCIIFAAFAAAIWNFLGYKFVVFKK